MEYSTYTKPRLAVPSFELYKLGRSQEVTPDEASAIGLSIVPELRLGGLRIVFVDK